VLQLKASGQTEARRVEFFRQCRESCRQNFLFAKRNGLKTATAHALSMLTALATVFTGIFLVLNQSITAGALIACVMLIWRITGPAQLAFSSGQKFTMMSGAIQQFDRFMGASPEQNEYRMEQPDRETAPTIKINQITLRYSANQEPVLSGVSADIESGDCVAVIGPNACGKTSLLLSLLGVVEPQAGFIMVNNKNLKQYDPETFREYTGYCPAEPDLFPGTLADNLRIAKPDATDEELIAALKHAGGESLFIALNSNLNIMLENNASNMLSAVEGSYINLARAFLKKSNFIILDEPLANRNPQARKAFSNTILGLKGKATIVFSSHDPELIKLADKVIVLDKGSVVYAGPIPEKNSQEMESSNHE
jgi:ATP-binding cassette subfamily C protein